MLEDQIIDKIARQVKARSGRAFVVGGSVRDKLLNIIPKDYDVEVYGLSADKLEEILLSIGEVKEVGRAFSVFKLVVNKIEIDVSLPRRESKIGPGHKGFKVEGVPDLDMKEACRRRDFTINAMMEDPLHGEVYDFFGGKRDLREKVLRAVDEKTFPDDPLRTLRAMQFLARFEMTAPKKTEQIVRKTLPNLKELASERLRQEFQKLFTESTRPSLGLKFAMKVGIFGALGFPEFEQMNGTPQASKHHPEGNVWRHTLLTTDAAALIVRREELEGRLAWLITLASFLHDTGKPAAYQINQAISAPSSFGGHGRTGMVLAGKFLRRLNAGQKITDKIKKIIKYHERPLWLDHDFREGKKNIETAIRKLAEIIKPATIYELNLVSEADKLGRQSYQKIAADVENRSSAAHSWLFSTARELGVLSGKKEPFVTGAELLSLGYATGPDMGRLQRRAEKMHSQGFTKKQILTSFKKK